MRPDQERVSGLIVSTIIKLCEKGLDFSSEVKIEGVIGITVDSKEAFVVHVNKTLSAGDNGYGHSNSSTSRISSSHNFQEATSSVVRDGAVSVESSSASDRSQMFTPNLSKVKEEKSDTTFPGGSGPPIQTPNISNTDLSATKDATTSSGSLHFFSTYNMPENTSPSHFDGSNSAVPCKADVLNPNQVVTQTSSNFQFNDEDTIDMKDSMPQLKMEDFSEPRLNQMADDNIQLKPSEVIDINSDDEDIPHLQKQLPQQQQQTFIPQHLQPQNFNIGQQNLMDAAYGNSPPFFKQETSLQYSNSQQFAPMNIQYPCPSPNQNQGFSGSVAQMNSPHKPLLMASPMKQQMDPSMFAQSVASQQQPMRMRAPVPVKRGRGSKTGGPPKSSNESISMALVPVQRPRQPFSPGMFDPRQQQQNFQQQPRASRPNQGMRMPTSSMQARAAGFPGQQRPPAPHRGRGGSAAPLGSRGGGRGGGGSGNVMNQVVKCQSGDGFSFNKQMTVLSQYSCNLCGKVYKNQRSVLHHQSQVHGRPKAKRKRKKATEEEDEDEEDINEGYDEGEEEDYGGDGEYYEEGDYGDEGW